MCRPLAPHSVVSASIRGCARASAPGRSTVVSAPGRAPCRFPWEKPASARRRETGGRSGASEADAAQPVQKGAAPAPPGAGKGRHPKGLPARGRRAPALGPEGRDERPQGQTGGDDERPGPRTLGSRRAPGLMGGARARFHFFRSPDGGSAPGAARSLPSYCELAALPGRVEELGLQPRLVDVHQVVSVRPGDVEASAQLRSSSPGGAPELREEEFVGGDASPPASGDLGGGDGDNAGKGWGVKQEVVVVPEVEQSFDAYAWAVAIAVIVPEVTAAQLVQLLGLVMLKGRGQEQGDQPPGGWAGGGPG